MRPIFKTLLQLALPLAAATTTACGSDGAADPPDAPPADAAPTADAPLDPDAAPPLDAAADGHLRFVDVTGHCEALWTVEGTVDRQALGAWVRTVDDLDGDGVRDVLLRAAVVDAQTQLEVHSGRDGSLISSFAVADALLRPEAAGDVDGDGFGDLGARSMALAGPGGGGGGMPPEPPASKAMVLSARLGTTLVTLVPVAAESGYGSVVAEYRSPFGGALLIGAPVTSGPSGGAGHAYVVSRTGEHLATVAPPEEATAQFGSRLLQSSDLDGDGIGEIVVSDPFHGLAAGSIATILSRDGRAQWTYVGAELEFLGDVFRAGADLNGDGTADVIVGSHNHAEGKESSGQVIALDGRFGNVLWTASARRAGEQLGHDVAILGDLDGDGIPDVLASAPYPAQGPIVTFGATGRIAVLSGRTGAVLVDLETAVQDPMQNSDRFGMTLDPLGDIDGDGDPDFVVAAPGAGALGTPTPIMTPLTERGAVVALSCRP